jgi:enoyl-CoA hydratase/carnithine racemase
MNDWKSIKVETFENLAVIQFIRPEIKNPLSIETLEEIKQILTSLELNSTIATVIFTGSGDAFASGADLREISQTTADNAREFALRGQNLMQRIYRSNKLTVAAIDGFCMGGALDLALSCKMRIASPRSIFAHPGANLGIVTGWGGTQLLPGLVGESKALEMFLTARRVEASEALRMGLIDKVAENPLADSIANFSGDSTSINL